MAGVLSRIPGVAIDASYGYGPERRFFEQRTQTALPLLSAPAAPAPAFYAQPTGSPGRRQQREGRGGDGVGPDAGFGEAGEFSADSIGEAMAAVDEALGITPSVSPAGAFSPGVVGDMALGLVPGPVGALAKGFNTARNRSIAQEEADKALAQAGFVSPEADFDPATAGIATAVGSMFGPLGSLAAESAGYGDLDAEGLASGISDAAASAAASRAAAMGRPGYTPGMVAPGLTMDQFAKQTQQATTTAAEALGIAMNPEGTGLAPGYAPNSTLSRYGIVGGENDEGDVGYESVQDMMDTIALGIEVGKPFGTPSTIAQAVVEQEREQALAKSLDSLARSREAQAAQAEAAMSAREARAAQSNSGVGGDADADSSSGAPAGPPGGFGHSFGPSNQGGGGGSSSGGPGDPSGGAPGGVGPGGGGDAPGTYARGGLVRAAEAIRSRGRHGDTVLAHINPREVQMLLDAGGSGTINPETGLPEFFGFEDVIGPALGGFAGNAFMGPIGGALGAAAGSYLTESEIDPLMAGAAGYGLSKLGQAAFGEGMTGLGDDLDIALGGLGLGDVDVETRLGGARARPSTLSPSEQLIDDPAAAPSIGRSLGQAGEDIYGGVEGFVSENPLTSLGILGTAAVALGGMGEEEEPKRAPQPATYDPYAGLEDVNYASITRNRTPAPMDIYTYGQRPGRYTFFDPVNPSVEYDRPEGYAEGGMVDEEGGGAMAAADGSTVMPGGGRYYEGGPGGGQDDTIEALLSNNEYVVPADVVAHLGDGTPEDGAEALDSFVANVRGHKTKAGSKHPPMAKSPLQYMKGAA